MSWNFAVPPGVQNPDGDTRTVDIRPLSRIPANRAQQVLRIKDNVDDLAIALVYCHV